MKNIIPILAISLLICATGCARQNSQPIYVWNDYSASLYSLRKDSSQENLNKHKEVLASIMEDSRKQGCRVPPGVYCEYGYILLKEGKQEEAIKYFDLETQVYPESTIFVQNLKTLAEKKTKTNDDAGDKVQNETIQK